MGAMAEFAAGRLPEAENYTVGQLWDRSRKMC